MTISVASYFPYWHFFYIPDGSKIGKIETITQLFSHNAEFKTSAFHCYANQFWILLLFIMMDCFYPNRFIWGGAHLCGCINSTTLSFFIYRWLSIFWTINEFSTLEMPETVGPEIAHNGQSKRRAYGIKEPAVVSTIYTKTPNSNL